MSFLSRVVWSEGMYIGPHHFQAQSRYFEDSSQFVASSMRRDYYGFLGCEVDAEALRNGTLALVHARGIFPDGLLFKMDGGKTRDSQASEVDPLPAPRNVAEIFPNDRDRAVAYLSISPHKPSGVNCALNEATANGARFTAQTVKVCDEVNGIDEKSLRLGRKNISLVLENELKPDAVSLPVARIQRSGAGRFILDPSFVPPVLEISASSRLMTMLERLLEVMDEKSKIHSRSGSSLSKTGYASREVASFWFLHAIYSGLAALRHIFHSTHGHPEDLYLEMARLAGSLCTFTIEHHPRSIPKYNHQQPEKTFDDLDRLIRKLLDIIIDVTCIPIPLVYDKEYLHYGAVVDPRCLGRCSWIFAIHCNIGAAQLIKEPPERIKICSAQFIQRLVKSALPGLPLTHMPVPPRAIAGSPETQYFQVDKKGPCWDNIIATKQVGVYVPGEVFPNPEVELFVVLDS